MNAPKFTPGPWLLYEGRDVIVERGNADEIGDEAYQIISTARVHGGHHFHCVCGEEQLANARLIAAAPELYEALDEAMDLVPRVSEDDPMAPALAEWCAKARAAMAKAVAP